MSRLVLVIDTSTSAVLAAVLRRHDDGRIEPVAERVTVDARAHVELLTPNVLAALADAGLTMAGLDAVVVGCGPGPFTGLRVGMSTAAAYGHALGVPVHGVCSLDAIGGQTDGEVLVVTDARRREVYWARYRDGVRVEGPAVCSATDVPIDGVAQVAGSPAHCALFALPQTGPEGPTPVGLVAAVGDWGREPDPLIPLYLRRPDAKTLAERGQSGKGAV
ncbi:MAG: tRNA (adenosine(37)-N6)-threonylcarbamoyltransferase complex dimerization subunit type 1 TsaB [Mycobacterium sp.]